MTQELAKEIAKQIADAGRDIPILQTVLDRFDNLSKEDKRSVVYVLAGILEAARESAGYSLREQR